MQWEGFLLINSTFLPECTETYSSAFLFRNQMTKASMGKQMSVMCLREKVKLKRHHRKDSVLQCVGEALMLRLLKNNNSTMMQAEREVRKQMSKDRDFALHFVNKLFYIPMWSKEKVCCDYDNKGPYSKWNPTILSSVVLIYFYVVKATKFERWDPVANMQEKHWCV